MNIDRDDEIQALLDAGQAVAPGDADAEAYQRLYIDLKNPVPKGLSMAFASNVLQKIKKAQDAHFDRRINLALGFLCFWGVFGTIFCLVSLNQEDLQGLGQLIAQFWPGILLFLFALWMYHWVSARLSVK
jgi:hypothetical protein